MNKRRTPYRKNVEKDVLEALPEPTAGQRIVRVVNSHGGNIFEVAFPPATPSSSSTNTDKTEASTTESNSSTPTTTLARLPTRFRKLIWVKRGTYLLCSSSDTDYQTATGEKGRVTMNVDYVLFERQVKHLQKKNMWPVGWSKAFNGVTEYSREEMMATKEEKSGNDVDGKSTGTSGEGEGVGEGEGEDNDDDIFINRNRMRNDDDSDTDLSSDDD